MSDYLDLKAQARGDRRPAFKFVIGNQKFELTDLRDTLELVEIALLYQSGQAESGAAQFAGYFRQYRPDVWKAVRASDDPIGYFEALIKAWTEHSKIDPKA